MGPAPPTDEELRRKYGQNVVILRSPPTREEIAKRRSRLELVGSVFGAQEWMWKSMTGRLIAVLIIVPGIFGAAQFWTNAAKVAHEYGRPYIAMVQEAALELSDELIVFGDPSSGDGQRQASNGPLAFIVPSTRIEVSRPERIETLVTERTLWRIGRPGFPPVGGHTLGGRWNSPGHLVLTAADDPLVAIEEVAAGGRIRTAFVLHELAVKGSFEFARTASLNLQELQATRAYGDQWLAEDRSSVLAVPSAINPTRMQYLLRLDDRNLSIVVRREFNIPDVA